MNWKVISRYIGSALLVSALFMFLSVIVSVAKGNDSALAALIISFTITFLVGIFPFIFVRRTNAITLKEGYVIVTLSWTLSFIFGMLPYALWGGPFTLQNAFFESVSGFTTCGATILDDIESLPYSLLFWRASTHFIGGLGVVVFLLLLLPGDSPMRLRLTQLELSSLSKGAYSSRPGKVAYLFAYVYIGLFIASTIAYLLAGMSLLDALCHAMSVVAAGGFSTKNLSIAGFDSFAIELITVVFMFLATIHFGLIYLSVVGRTLKPLNNPIVKLYLVCLAVMTLIVSCAFMAYHVCDDFGQALWGSLFSTLSVASTTGFAIMDNAHWPMFISFLLLFPGFFCACSGSTSGGVKLDRALLFFKTIGKKVSLILHPSAIGDIKLGRRLLRDEEVSPHILYLALYVGLIFVSALLCLFGGMEFDNSIVASVMSLGNVGPACGELGTMGSYNSVSLFNKLVLCFDMFVGRIEIYPVLAVAAMIFDRRH